MRILVALDEHSYSAGIINSVARLAANTWADVTLLGIRAGGATGGTFSMDHPLVNTFMCYKDDFLGQFAASESPYTRQQQISLTENNGIWEIQGTSEDSRKELKIHIRQGNPDREILEEARQAESDLIVLGCSGGVDCQWQGLFNLPEKIAKDASCSVLVIKEERIPKKIICCMDQPSVSQASVEMINQVVTINKADLEIIGFTGPKGLKEEVQRQLDGILRYYMAQQINAWVKLVDMEALEEYVAQASRDGMIALWMGKKSLLQKIFNLDLVGKLVTQAQSSVLILR
jgi:nucleotide-binding universal stress UspA family protein